MVEFVTTFKRLARVSEITSTVDRVFATLENKIKVFTIWYILGKYLIIR
jgi:hypothetical protein